MICSLTQLLKKKRKQITQACKKNLEVKLLFDSKIGTFPQSVQETKSKEKAFRSN